MGERLSIVDGMLWIREN